MSIGLEKCLSVFGWSKVCVVPRLGIVPRQSLAANAWLVGRTRRFIRVVATVELDDGLHRTSGWVGTCTLSNVTYITLLFEKKYSFFQSFPVSWIRPIWKYKQLIASTTICSPVSSLPVNEVNASAPVQDQSLTETHLFNLWDFSALRS